MNPTSTGTADTSLTRWLFDLDIIQSDAGKLDLAWAHPWPGWVWAILFIGAGLFAVWSYSRLTGNRLGRGLLAAARFLIILLVLIIISGPMLELRRETVEEDWVIMLADRSASMGIADAGDGTRVTRDQSLRKTIADNAATFEALADKRQLVWMGFHMGTFSLNPEIKPETPDIAPPPSDSVDTHIARMAEALPELGNADGARTSISVSLEQALQRAAARPLSGLVLFSDGRTDDPPTRALVRRLQAEAVPVFVVPLGSDEPLGDLAIQSVDAPRRAFIRDKVPVVVDLDRLGESARAMGATVKLIDEATGEELDSATLEPGSSESQVTLTAEPKLAGEANWKVVIESAQPDLIPDNNSKTFLVELVDRPLRVLFVEGYPRWEYRYVKNLMVRESTIESSVMLISAQRDFAQEGNQPITRLPRTAEEFAAYDVIIIGDVAGTFFSPEQLDMIRNHVADRGAGLLWIAGERYVPESYAGTSLSDLLPIRGSLHLEPIAQPITMVTTPLAKRLGVLQLEGGTAITDAPAPSASSEPAPLRIPVVTGWPQELADPSFGWSLLYYAQRIEPDHLKPTAEVLATSVQPLESGPAPLVIHMRYGTGQSMYVATDEVWRWRYGRGEWYNDQFWLQIIRMLGRESLAGSGEALLLEVNPRRLEANQPMRIELRLLDAQLVQQQRTHIAAVLEDAEGRTIAEIDLKRTEGSEDRFAATYLSDVTGEFRVRVKDASLAGVEATAPVEVYMPDDELRHPETDHALLSTLAESTGGKVLSPGDISRLPELLPNRAVHTINPLSEPIWDTPLVFILLMTLLTLEWVGRKVLRLV